MDRYGFPVTHPVSIEIFSAISGTSAIVESKRDLERVTGNSTLETVQPLHSQVRLWLRSARVALANAPCLQWLRDHRVARFTLNARRPLRAASDQMTQMNEAVHYPEQRKFRVKESIAYHFIWLHLL